MNVKKVQPILVSPGYGEVKVKPNVAYMPLTVETIAKSADEATSENAKLSDALYNILEKEGIPREDVKTLNNGLFPVTKDKDDKKEDGNGLQEEEIAPEVIGWRAINQVSATIRDIDKVGHFIDVIAQSGNFQRNNTGFGLQDKEEEKARKEALIRAIENARTRAKITAKASGKKLADVQSIQIGGSRRAFGENVVRTLSVSRGTESVPTQVMPGELDISESVTVQFLLKKK